MNIKELESIKIEADYIFDQFQGKDFFSSSISFTESPNPVYVFDINGIFCVQGSFWANNEYAIEAIDSRFDTGLIESRGFASNVFEATKVISEFINNLKLRI